METTTLQAEVRETRGKGPARRLRMEGKLPAVVYGPGVEPTPLTVDPIALRRALEGPKGRNMIFVLPFGGKETLAMVKDLMVEPVGRALLHADFYAVEIDKPVTAYVTLTTHGRALGVVQGGVLKAARRTVPVRCTPDKIPAIIDVDVSAMNIGDTVRAQDLQLPEGVVCTLRPTQAIVLVTENKRIVELEEDEETTTAAATPEA